MEVAGEGGKTALAAGRKESQDLWLSPRLSGRNTRILDRRQAAYLASGGLYCPWRPTRDGTLAP